MARGHKRGSGERSNIYSKSKFTNWRSFDPYEEEISSLPTWMDANLTVETALGDHIAIVAREPHTSFLSPVTPGDVRDLLLRVPPEFLVDLRTVYLLGGTSKQDKVALGDLFRYGSYRYSKIALYAFPKRLLSKHYSKLPPPDTMKEYERIGATWTSDRDGWLFQFSIDALRAYYLHVVLLHEIGHHIDRETVFKKPRGDSERYARWFTSFCGRRLEPR